MAKSPEEMAASMIAGLKEKTGKSLDEWIKIVKASKLAKHGEIVNFLKTEHGVGHGYANLIVHSANEKAAGGAPADDDLVAAQYAGQKAALKPVYDKLIAAVQKFGGDVEVSPKKSYVSLRRSKQFALAQPSKRLFLVTQKDPKIDDPRRKDLQEMGVVARVIQNLRLPNGKPLLRIDGLQVVPGEAVWLSGASGLGKTTLFKAVAGLWTPAEGRIGVPGGTTMMLPQRPYVPA